MPKPEEFEKYRRDLLKKRKSEAFDINTESVQTKIQTYIKLNPEFTQEEVEREIGNNPMFRAYYYIDPIRGNIYEGLLAPYIKKISGVKNFGKPKPSVYPYDGSLLTKKELKSRQIRVPGISKTKKNNI